MAATAAPPHNVTFVSQVSLTWYEASPGVEYGFCNRCGSSLFWRAEAHPEKLSIAAGTLDLPTRLQTTQAWWVSEASDYYDRPSDLIEFDTE
jgi:hypothetical protein